MKPAMKDIARATAAYFEITTDDLYGQGRARRVSWPRQIAMALSHIQARRSLAEIGEFFGGRDHTTAIHALHTVTDDVANDNETLRAMMVIGAEAAWMASARKAKELEWVQRLHANQPVPEPPPPPSPPTQEPKPLPKVAACEPRRVMVLNGRGEFINRGRPPLLPSEFKADPRQLMGRRA